MTNPQPFSRRSLQTRLALVYAAGVYVAGIVVLAAVTVPLVDARSTVPFGSSTPATVTGGGDGIGPHQLLVGSAVALAVDSTVAVAVNGGIGTMTAVGLGEPLSPFHQSSPAPST